MPQLVVTTCTDRKRHSPLPDLRARQLRSGSLSNVAIEWQQKVSGATPVGMAGNLYCGRAFFEARSASCDLEADLWVVSAGLGLIPATKEIPAYSLTTSFYSDDNIAKKIIRPEWSPTAWWAAMKEQERKPATIGTLLEDNPSRTILVALSESYAELLRDDLNSIPEKELRRLRLFGLRLKSVLCSRLHPFIMPYDRRLDGSDSPIRGTLGDFSQRALRHFSSLILSGEIDGMDVEHDRKIVGDTIQPWGKPVAPQRTQKSDEEIRSLIQIHWNTVQGRSGQMLRYLRDDLKVACEQGRFRRLFHQVMAKLSTTQGELL